MPTSAKEGQLVDELIFYSQLLVEAGLLEFKGGNLSARLNDDEMIITRRSLAKGIPSPSDLVRTSIHDIDDGGSTIASSALEVHRSIYQKTDSGAVIHAHPSETVTLSFFMDKIVPIDENGLLYLRPGVSVVPPPSLFGWNLAAEEMGECLREEAVVVQKWHGTFAKGDCLADAYHRTRAVEFMSAQIIRVKQMEALFGQPTPVPTEIASVMGGLPGRGLRSISAVAASSAQPVVQSVDHTANGADHSAN